MLFGSVAGFFIVMLVVSLVVGVLISLSPVGTWYRKKQARMYANRFILPALKDPETLAEIERVIAETKRKEKIGK